MKTGRNIRSVRKQKGLTLDELSALCGVSRDDLGLYERGQMTPRLGTVEKIAQALDVPIVAIQEGMGWTAHEPLEGWEASGTAPLRDGIVEAVREFRGEDFIPDEADIRLLMESVKAAVPALAEHLKDTRPEREINKELLEKLNFQLAISEEEQIRRYRLTDGQWAQLKDLLPPENTGRGRALKSNRLMLEGILYHLKSGTAWKELPERFGRYKCVSGRLRLWQRTGIWESVLDKLRELNILEEDQPQ